MILLSEPEVLNHSSDTHLTLMTEAGNDPEDRGWPKEGKELEKLREGEQEVLNH